MPNRKNAHFILWHHKPIQCDVASLTIRSDELPYLAIDTPANQRMRPKAVNGRLNCCYGIQRCSGVLFAQELNGAFNRLQGTRRMDYLRHGLGRGADSSVASRFIHA